VTGRASSRSAPTRKQSPPNEVNAFARARFRTSPVAGTTYDATAEIPNATQPRRLTAAIRHSASRGRHDAGRPETSTYAR
jgi:hypothetical protein